MFLSDTKLVVLLGATRRNVSNIRCHFARRQEMRGSEMSAIAFLLPAVIANVSVIVKSVLLVQTAELY
jgi:hypothetical protein